MFEVWNLYKTGIFMVTKTAWLKRKGNKKLMGRYMYQILLFGKRTNKKNHISFLIEEVSI